MQHEKNGNTQQAHSDRDWTRMPCISLDTIPFTFPYSLMQYDVSDLWTLCITHVGLCVCVVAISTCEIAEHFDSMSTEICRIFSMTSNSFWGGFWRSNNVCACCVLYWIRCYVLNSKLRMPIEMADSRKNELCNVSCQRRKSLWFWICLKMSMFFFVW